MTNIDKMIDCFDGIELFLSIGKNVDDVQDELKNLLFGEEDEASNYGSLTEKVNILDYLALYHQTKIRAKCSIAVPLLMIFVWF